MQPMPVRVYATSGSSQETAREPHGRQPGSRRGAGAAIGALVCTFLVAIVATVAALHFTGAIDVTGLFRGGDDTIAQTAPDQTTAEDEREGEGESHDAPSAQTTVEPASPQATQPQEVVQITTSEQDSSAGSGSVGNSGAETEPRSDEQYILADSSTRRYKRSELEQLSDWELLIARNEIYARHGREFNDAELRSYFESRSWYSGTIEPKDFSEDMLNAIEKDNAYLLLQVESSRQ